MSSESKEIIIKTARAYALRDAKLNFKQGFSFNEGEDINQIDKLKTEINRLTLTLKENRKMTDSIISKPLVGKQLLAEIKALFPEIKSCSYAETISFQDTQKKDKIKIVVMQASQKKLTTYEKKRIDEWLKKRLQTENVKSFFED